MVKAFDRLEWNFIKNTLTYMGLPGNCINVIMHCFSCVFYFSLINGNPIDTLRPSRGIR